MVAVKRAPSAEPFVGPGIALALGLGLFFLCAGLFLLKFWYIKHRRIRSIHRPPITHVQLERNIFDESSLWTDTSRLHEFGVRDIESAEKNTRDAVAPQEEKRKSSRAGLLVGMLGSPSWEIKITRAVDTTTRAEAAAQDKEQSVVHRTVDEIPLRRLKRMASRSTMAYSPSTSVHSLLSGVSPRLGPVLSPPLPGSCVLDSTLSLPEQSSTQIPSPVLAKSRGLALLDRFSSQTHPPSLQARKISSPVSNSGALPTVPSGSTTQNSNPLGLAFIPPKAVSRLGIHLPLGTPHSTWSSYGPLPNPHSPSIGSPIVTPHGSPVPHSRSGSVTSASSSESRFSIRRKPVPRFGGTSTPSMSLASITPLIGSATSATSASSLSLSAMSLEGQPADSPMIPFTPAMGSTAGMNSVSATPRTPLSILSASSNASQTTPQASVRHIDSPESSVTHPMFAHQRVCSLSSLRSVQIVAPAALSRTSTSVRLSRIPSSTVGSRGPSPTFTSAPYSRYGSPQPVAESVASNPVRRTASVGTLRTYATAQMEVQPNSRPVTPRDVSNPPAIYITSPSPAKRRRSMSVGAVLKPHTDTRNSVHAEPLKLLQHGAGHALVRNTSDIWTRRSRTLDQGEIKSQTLEKVFQNEALTEKLELNPRDEARQPLTLTTRLNHPGFTRTNTFGVLETVLAPKQEPTPVVRVETPSSTHTHASHTSSGSRVHGTRLSPSPFASDHDDRDDNEDGDTFKLVAPEIVITSSAPTGVTSSVLDLSWSSSEMSYSSRNGPGGNGTVDGGGDDLSAVYGDLFSHWEEAGRTTLAHTAA